MNTILYIVCLLVLVAPMGFWMWKLRRSTSKLHCTLMWWYAAFAVLLLCDGLHILNVCVADTVDWSLIMSLLTVSVLFYFPVLVLLQQTIIQAHPVGVQTIALYVFPSALYTIFVSVIRLFYGLDHIIATPWMHQVEMVGYYYILFLNIIAGLFICVWRYRKHHFRVCNYYPDRNKSDDAAVRRVTHISILVGTVVFFFLLLPLTSINHNWPATAVIIAIIFFVSNYLGYALCSVNGNTVPTGFDWSSKAMTLEEISVLEQRQRQADELASVKNAARNITSIIENWVSQPDHSYLRAGITLTEAAYEMNVPANLLSSYINKTLDTNFNQWINSYRLKHVKYLLLTTNNTLDEIAEASGFATRNLLSRTFKAHEGITPSEFRTKNKK